MKIVIDANIFFYALLKEGVTRSIIFKSEFDFIAPTYLLFEFSKHRNYLIKKYSGSESEFEELVKLISSKIAFINDKELIPFVPASKTLTTDPYDVLYFALALKENATIWTNDRAYLEQTRVEIWTTAQLIKEVYTKS